jgi:cation diffusion facilitator CzcD-associated flavoprotein CzcO
MAERRPAAKGGPVDDRTRVAIVGAGPAGLATAHALRRRDIAYRAFERGPAVADAWRNLYDSLTLHTGRHLSALPGAPFPRGTPLFPSRADLVEYLQRYHDRFDLGVETGVTVRSACRSNGGWSLDTSAGKIEAAVLVVATGILAQPVVPRFEGQECFAGRIRHAVEYRRPDGHAGRRVLVVGCGNTAGDIATELAEAGATVTVAVRTGANVVPLTLLGIPIQYVASVLRNLPDAGKKAVTSAIERVVRARRGPPVLPRPPYGPLESIPMIGFHLVDAVREGRVRIAPGVASLEAGGARFSDGSSGDFDEVILATGYRPAIDFLGDAIRVSDTRHARRTDRVTSADQPGLFFVGHNYDAAGGLRNIARDAPLAADRIARLE